MSITALTAKEIAQLGANIVITEKSSFTALTVKEIIKIAVSNGGTVTVHAASYTALTLKEFVKLGGNSITIEI